MSEINGDCALLDTLDALGFIARHLHPPRLDALVATLGDRDAALREVLTKAVWPEQLRDPIGRAAEATLRAATGCARRSDRWTEYDRPIARCAR